MTNKQTTTITFDVPPGLSTTEAIQYIFDEVQASGGGKHSEDPLFDHEWNFKIVRNPTRGSPREDKP